ncbi:MAG: FAD-dependent oxidoreductase [Rhodobacteraceae bacterium]|nr:FAD-dependent oxidoreductase [Paracoccaceae bacterium]
MCDSLFKQRCAICAHASPVFRRAQDLPPRMWRADGKIAQRKVTGHLQVLAFNAVALNVFNNPDPAYDAFVRRRPTHRKWPMQAVIAKTATASVSRIGGSGDRTRLAIRRQPWVPLRYGHQSAQIREPVSETNAALHDPRDRSMVTLPEHASVVVIGKDVMGGPTLYHRVNFGADAVLLERKALMSGTTWHSAAKVRALRRPRRLTRMIQYSVALSSALEDETGQSVGWIRKGSLSLAIHADHLTLNRQQKALAPICACEDLYLLTKPEPRITGTLPTVCDHDNHLQSRDDRGGLLVGCFEPMRTATLHRLPARETAVIKRLLNDPESFTPDGVFMLGETAKTRGLFLGCDMNSIGAQPAEAWA